VSADVAVDFGIPPVSSDAFNLAFVDLIGDNGCCTAPRDAGIGKGGFTERSSLSGLGVGIAESVEASF